MKEARFIGCYASLPIPLHLQRASQIALVGRSNVGKSSLINHLTQKEGLAKVSATPGKTVTINFFDLGGARFLVDLPGYGYSAFVGPLKKKWNSLLEGYFLSCQPYLLILMDSRHPPTALDKQMIAWASEKQLPYDCILTKIDKLNQKEFSEALSRFRDFLGKEPLLYSTKDPSYRKRLVPHLEMIYKQGEGGVDASL